MRNSQLPSDGGWLVSCQRKPTCCQLAQLICPFWGCPPRAIGIVSLQRFPHLDHDEVPRIVDITHYVGRKKPRAGAGRRQDRADSRLGIGRGIGAELDVEHGSDGHGTTVAGVIRGLDGRHLTRPRVRTAVRRNWTVVRVARKPTLMGVQLVCWSDWVSEPLSG